MPGLIDFEMKGAKELQRLLKELGPQVASKVGDKALRAGARPIVAEAKRLVPVRTGALRRAITTAVERRRKGQAERVIVIGFKKPHSRRAHLTEFGTRFTAAKPFMRPALDTKAGAALTAMGDELARGIAEEAAKLSKPVR